MNMVNALIMLLCFVDICEENGPLLRPVFVTAGPGATCVL